MIHVAAHTLSTRVPGQARPVMAASWCTPHIRAQAGIFISQLRVKTPDLHALLRTALRTGTRVEGIARLRHDGGGAMTMAAHAISLGVIPALMQRTRCIRSWAGNRPSRDHGAMQKLGWVPSRDPMTCTHAIGDGMTMRRERGAFVGWVSAAGIDLARKISAPRVTQGAGVEDFCRQLLGYVARTQDARLTQPTVLYVAQA